jgi:hypothetical protein
MASTVAAVTLTVTIDEDLPLNGRQCGSRTTKTFTGINEYRRTIQTCYEDDTARLMHFAAATADVEAAGEYLLSALQYARITNLDDTVVVELIVVCATGDVVFKLQPGESFVMVGGGTSMALTAGTGVTATTFTALLGVSCHVTTGNADVEVFVALS